MKFVLHVVLNMPNVNVYAEPFTYYDDGTTAYLYVGKTNVLGFARTVFKDVRIYEHWIDDKGQACNEDMVLSKHRALWREVSELIADICKATRS